MAEPVCCLPTLRARGATIARRAAMALSKLSGDAQCIIFSQLCNVLEPSVAVYFGSASSELRVLTQELLQQLRADYEAAAALCRKLGMRITSCKELREAKTVEAGAVASRGASSTASASKRCPILRHSAATTS